MSLSKEEEEVEVEALDWLKMNSLAESASYGFKSVICFQQYGFKNSDLITTPKWYINDRP